MSNTSARLTNQKKLNAATRELGKLDPKMALLIEHFGMPEYRPWERGLFTALISSIISQQLSVKAAATILGRVKMLVDTEQEFSAADLVKLSHEQLRSAGLSNAKVKYTLGLANAVVAGELDFESLAKANDEEIKQTLIQYSGVGNWTAEMFLLFAVGSPDVLATGDLGLQRGMRNFLDLDDYPDEQTFISEAKIWRPYRSIASWYLWRLAE